MPNPSTIDPSGQRQTSGRIKRANMPARTKLSAAALAVVMGSAMAACGDQITANHDWYSIASITTSQVRSVDGGSLQTLTLDGPLLTSNTGRAVPATHFHLGCVQYDDHLGHKPYNCLLLLNAGEKAYVASARQDKVLSSDLPHLFFTLTDPASRLSYTVLGVGTKSVHLKLTARHN